jgi:hypothetical protein
MLSKRTFFRITGITALVRLCSRILGFKEPEVDPKEAALLMNAYIFEHQRQSWFQRRREKKAIAAVDEFTYRKMREDGFCKRILPMIPITNEELDRIWPPVQSTEDKGEENKHVK